MLLEPSPDFLVPMRHRLEATLAVDDVADGGGGSSGVLGDVAILLASVPALDAGDGSFSVHPAMGLSLLLLVHQSRSAEVHPLRVLVQQHPNAFHCVRYVESEHGF